MPTYRYRCAKCGEEPEEWQSFSDEPLNRHRACGGKLSKVFSTPGIVLKGSGFYRTDNRNGSSSKPRSKEQETAGAPSSGSGSDGASEGGSEGGSEGASNAGTTGRTGGEKTEPATGGTEAASGATTTS